MTVCGLILLASALQAPVAAAEPCSESVTAQIRIDAGHPWRPPFGLDRVGKPLAAVVEIAFEKNWQAPYGPAREYSLVGYRDGKEVERRVLQLAAEKSAYTGRALFESYPAELALLARCRFRGEPVEVARIAVPPAGLEAEAAARPEEALNPVDLGAILVPADWLLLRAGQKASVDVVALSRAGDVGQATVRAWFASLPDRTVAATLSLANGARARARFALPAESLAVDHDVLHLAVSNGQGKELWRKRIETMLVRQPPPLPAFGATELKLRYDAPISVRDPQTGALSSRSYRDAWDPRLNDVVVSFPTGARFVFWRGSSYVPFWAGRYNTGLSYEWAETSPPPDGFVDSVEPLMDKELRYGRVQVVESTPARVHVRWSYQSCDFTYKVWGDSAAEDFYFYPDGFGTRLLNLKNATGADYELSEFIILTPAAAYPFDVLPRNLVDLIFVDGDKQELLFPYVEGPKGRNYTWPDSLKDKVRRTPVVYRVRLNKREPQAAVYFNPLDTNLPPAIFSPFFDRGYMVTPAYWGSHWPLARGKTTGYAIDDRVSVSPAHNSVMSWVRSSPAPVSVATVHAIDTLGRSRPITVRQWLWLIGMSDASDARLLDWARSFSRPPALEVKGARYDFDAYVPERRSFRLRVEDKTVEIGVKPLVKCVNPVFELLNAPGSLTRVSRGGRALASREYAWDGKTLWLDATIEDAEQLRLEFSGPAR